MKIREDKGITLVALVVTFILLGIITTVSVAMGTSFMKSAKFENIETYLLLIQSKSKIMADKIAIGELEVGEIRGKKQQGGKYDGWYRLSQEDLNEMGLNKAREEDGYFVDYESGDVAYAKGVTLGDYTFYELSQISTYKNLEK